MLIDTRYQAHCMKQRSFLTTVVTVTTVVLAGCGSPEDDDDGGGAGYVLNEPQQLRS